MVFLPCLLPLPQHLIRMCSHLEELRHGPLSRYIKLRVAHAPGMPGTFSPPLWVSDPDMHQGMCVTHVPWCMSGSLTSGLLWKRWRGKRSRHSRRMRNPQFYVSGKRPIATGGRLCNHAHNHLHGARHRDKWNHNLRLDFTSARRRWSDKIPTYWFHTDSIYDVYSCCVCGSD